MGGTDTVEDDHINNWVFLFTLVVEDSQSHLAQDFPDPFIRIS